MNRLLFVLIFVVGFLVNGESKQVGSEVSIEVEIMYKKGLNYLAKIQKPDGSFPDAYGQYTSVTSLALLCFVACGEDPNFGAYSENIKRGVRYILSKQDGNGYFGYNMYNQNYTTLCLAELAGFLHEERLGVALEKAVKQILTAQSHNIQGGWYYDPFQKTQALSTLTGTALVALLAARNAGVEVPQKAIEQGLELFTKFQTPTGRIGYSGPTDDNRDGRTALALLCFHLARQREHSTARKAAVALRESIYKLNAGTHDWYGIYYTPQALFQEDMEGFEKWNKQNIQSLKSSQAADGGWNIISDKGSLSTGVALLSLAMNYRILPIYERQE